MSVHESAWDNGDRPPDERFLVDGVAPAVIGGADVEQHDPNPTPPSLPVPDREPPTAPIPAQSPNGRPERRSWFGKLFRSG